MVRAPPDQWRRSRARQKLVSKTLDGMKKKRNEMTADKEGIKITSEPAVNNGTVQLFVPNLKETPIITFHITNEGPNPIYFTQYIPITRIDCFTLEDKKLVDSERPLLLSAGESYDVIVKFTLEHQGYLHAKMCFEFQLGLPDAKPFHIVREMEAVSETPLSKKLRPTAPYKPDHKRARSRFVPGPKRREKKGVTPESSPEQYMSTEVKLKEYKCPAYLKEFVKEWYEKTQRPSRAPNQRFAAVKDLLSSALDMNNYFKRFNLLLHLEEMKIEKDIRKYDLHDQTMTRDPENAKLLVLKVPGLAENRPSVLIGDCVKASKSQDSTTVYIGYVHKVERDSLKLSFFDNLLTFVHNTTFDVEFTINRLTLKLQHRAVELATKHHLKEVLFPSGAAASNIPLPDLRWYNAKVKDNEKQCRAVQHIVAGSSKPAPYVLFGPPGTGKTVTLVEAILQIINADPSAHILACSPTNSACDMLCERLRDLKFHDMYRMCAKNLNPSRVPEYLWKYCTLDRTKSYFVFPEKDKMMKYKVIVTTLLSAGRLVTIGIPSGHFSHVFVDEAGQAPEPMCVIAVAGLLSAEKGQLVLAGDPRQLGPILQSPLAIQHGLQLSLLERLMEHNELYKDSDSLFVTKLLKNYRSHCAILKVPNVEFYNGELEASAHSERQGFSKWPGLPQENFPVIFHGVIGKEERESNSPSYFNISEIEVVVQYVNMLKTTNSLPKVSALGIITPYRKQVEKIRKALTGLDLKDIKVGSVEEFQGQERDIIIISTVRSSMDKDWSIGFLSNKKRINVALTRAKSLLVVVGNPLILKTEPVWEKFINYCVEMKGYTGFDLKKAQAMDELGEKMLYLRICSEGDESALQQYMELSNLSLGLSGDVLRRLRYFVT